MERILGRRAGRVVIEEYAKKTNRQLCNKYAAILMLVVAGKMRP
jgi:hypothetical protein